MTTIRPPSKRRRTRTRDGRGLLQPGTRATRLTVAGQLTASIAHEINQPLGAILSNVDAAEMLMDSAAPPLEQVRRILADIRRDGLRASAVIRNVRSLVRRQELAPERIDAGALADEVVVLLEADARQRRIPLATVHADAALMVFGDRALLQQMLINLLVNAMDSVAARVDADLDAAAAPHVALHVVDTGRDELEFQVVDNGLGVPSDRVAQLFDSFYTSKPHGMGLGLAIARSVVEAHGGRIRVENNSPAGARFCVALPHCHLLMEAPPDEVRNGR